MDENRQLREEINWLSQRIEGLQAEHRRMYRDLEQEAARYRQLEEEAKINLALQRVINEVLRMKTQEDWHGVMTALHRELEGLVRFNLCSIQFVDRINNRFVGYGSNLQRASYREDLNRYLELTPGLRRAVESGLPLYRRNRREIEQFGEHIAPAVNSVVDVPFAGGTLAMNSLEENAFSEREIHILEQFAQVMSEAYYRLQTLQRQEAVQRVREEVWRMERVEDIQKVLVALRGQLLVLRVPFDGVGMNVVDESTAPASVDFHSCWGEGDRWAFWRAEAKEAHQVVVHFWREGKPVYRPDLQTEDRFGEATALSYLPYLVRSVVDVPFVRGTLALNSRHPHAFSAADIAFLQELAGALSEGLRRQDDLRALERRAQEAEALAIERAQHLGDLEREMVERQRAEESIQLNLALQRVRNEALLMESEPDWEKVLRSFHRELSRLVEFWFCSIQLIDQEAGRYTYYTTSFSAEDYHRQGRELLELPPSLRQVVETGEYLYRRTRVEVERCQDLVGIEVNCILDVPFLGGTIAVNSLEENAFTGRDIHILEQFAQVVSEAYRRLEDLKKLAQTEQQLRQAQKMEAIGQLTAGIAHNFNNMLQAIILNLQMCLEEAPAPLAAGLRDAEEEAVRAAEMIRQLMVFGRRATSFRHAPVDLRQVVQDTVEICRRTFDRRIELSLDLPADLPAVLGDATLVQQALVNLCVNARDALEEVERPRLQLQVKALACHCGAAAVRDGAAPGWYVCLQVVDNGAGMDPGTQERLFEPFFTTKEPGKGTGLGLATVYGIARDHRGWIECRSTRGTGTTFSLYLPALEQGAPRKEPRPAPAPALEQGAGTILVIEDDHSNRRVMTRFLEQAGYAVLEGVDGPDGLEVFRREQERIDLVLLDVSMPGLSGQEVLAALRQLAPGLRAVVYSGYAVDEARFAGAGAILQKPVRAEELGRVVRRVLEGPSGPVGG